MAAPGTAEFSCSARAPQPGCGPFVNLIPAPPNDYTPRRDGGMRVTVRRSRGIVRPGSEIGARSRPESCDTGRSLSLLIKDITASPNGYRKSNRSVRPYTGDIGRIIDIGSRSYKRVGKKPSRHSPVAKAMDHMLRCWELFARLLEDGRICLTNNAAGKKVWVISDCRKVDWARRANQKETVAHAHVTTEEPRNVRQGGKDLRHGRQHA